MSSASFWKEVTLVEKGTGKRFTIRLTKEEVNRLGRDPRFLTQVLQNCKEAAATAEAAEAVEAEAVEAAAAAAEVATTDSNIRVEDGFRWSHDAILLLITLFEENEPKLLSPNHTNKSVWGLISSRFKEDRGYDITGKQCESKWSGLKKVYKRIKDHNKVSGHDRRTWLYYDVMNTLLGKRPEVDPVSTADSSGKPVSRKRRRSYSDSDESLVDDENEKNNTSTPRTKIGKHTKKMTQQEMFAAMEEKKDTRHRERMAQNDKIIALLQKLLPENSTSSP